MYKKALFMLEDGTKFYGKLIGCTCIEQVLGEVVFNTAMSGYQEILTDPSYYGQIIVFTSSHIGNVGTNNIDNESDSIKVKGIVVKNFSFISSNFRNLLSLNDFLKKHNIIGISDIDTRRITVLLRTKGIQIGCIQSLKNNFKKNRLLISNIQNKLKSYQLNNINNFYYSIKKKSYEWMENSKGVVEINSSVSDDIVSKSKDKKYNIVVYDYGVKHSILRMLVDRYCKVIVVPANTIVTKIFKLCPDGIVLSNGPGNPLFYNNAITSIKLILKKNIPIFGICLGFQLLAIASGAKIIKMLYGHHGVNHAIQDLKTKKIMVLSQNHNYSVDIINLPKLLEVTHISLIDNTIQGLSRIDKYAFGIQGHPEGNPGPKDAEIFFDKFIDMIKIYKLFLNSTKGI